MRSLLMFLWACATPTTFSQPTTPVSPPEMFGALEIDPARTIPASPGDSTCMDVALADLDLDGDLDVVLALEGPANAVLENDGNGQMTQVETVAFRSPTDSEQAAIGDLDQDGCPDLYFANEDLGGIDEWYRGDCGMGFVDATSELPHATPEAALPANSAVVVDLDQDGWLDVVVGHRGQTAWWRGSKTGWIDATAAFPKDAATTQDVAVADLDGDGDLDVVLGNEGPNAVWLHDGDNWMDVSDGLPVNNRETRSVEVLDADGDGHLDLIIGNVGWSGNNPQSQLLMGDGTLGFTDATNRLPEESFDTLQWQAVDLDADGDPDLLGANTQHGNGQLLAGPWVAWQNERGDFVDQTQTWLPDGPVGFGLSVASGDLDGDGWLDAYLCARSGPDRVLFGRPRLDSAR